MRIPNWFGMLSFLAVSAAAYADYDDLVATVTDRSTVEDVMDAVQPGWTFTANGTTVKVGWTNGASVPSVKIGGVSKTYYWYTDGTESGYRCDDATWIKLSFQLGKALAPVLATNLSATVGEPNGTNAVGAGHTAMTYHEMKSGLGETISNPDSVMGRCGCVGTSNPCSIPQCNDGVNCSGGHCSFGWVPPA